MHFAIRRCRTTESPKPRFVSASAPPCSPCDMATVNCGYRIMVDPPPEHMQSARVVPCRRPEEPSPVPRRLELDAEADSDRAPGLKDTRIVDGKPVLDPIPVLVLSQEGASRPARLRVVHDVRLRVDRARGPEVGLECHDALRVEEIRRLHVEREVLPPRGDIPLPLHGEGRHGRETLRVHEVRVLHALPPLVRRIREAGPELINERRPPVLLVRQTQCRRKRMALIPSERLFRYGLELISEIPLVLERAIRIGRGPRHVPVAVVHFPAEP